MHKEKRNHKMSDKKNTKLRCRTWIIISLIPIVTKQVDLNKNSNEIF